MFSVDGLASGLDTASIVESALASQQARIDRLNVQRQGVEQEQTAFKTVEGQLFGLQGSLRNILRSSNNAFDKKSAASSDVEAIEVSASSSATAGTYRLRVTQLAQSHQIKSNGYADDSDFVGSGDVTIRVGNRAEATVNVSEGTTLQGLAAAINAQTTDVRATVIDDGSSENSFRLLMTSRFSGAEHEIAVDHNLTGDSEPAELDFSGPPVQEAQDAQVQIGTGDGAITISSEENQFDSLLPGVTIDVLRADPEKDIVITVTEDTESVVSAIEGFVSSYNDVVEFIDSNSRFDPDANTAGLFLGNRSAANVQSTLRRALGSVVEGVNEKVKTLSSIGIRTNDSGKLTLDKSTLQDILSGRKEGTGIDDIRRLFAIDGQSDNPGVEFVLGTNNTAASPIDPDNNGELVPYEVEITRAAATAELSAVAPLLENTVINADNNTFQIEVDRTAVTIKIPAGTYGRDALAEQVQTLFNTSDDRAGRQIEATLESNHLVIASTSFGKSSSVEILAGTGNAPLGLTVGQVANGEDVAGVFRIQVPGEDSKRTEKAVGNGRTLTGDSDNDYTAQLQVRSSLQTEQIAADPDARLTVTRGIGAALDAAIGELLGSGSNNGAGALAAVDDRYTAQLEAIDENISQVESRIETRREALVRQFAALEVTLAELQSTGDALTSSLLTL